MPNLNLLAVFIPTFFFVAITPGMCMTLAMTLGMHIGVKRSLWMMLGELIGVAIVSFCAVFGVASLMLNYPQLFQLLKWLGGAYLCFIGFQMWQSQGQIKLNSASSEINRRSLISQGFITAIVNPKGWAFMISLLPPFINIEQAVVPQLLILVSIILATEFLSMLAYASGGRSLRTLLNKGNNIHWLNRIAGSLMIFVGIWLALG